MAHTGSMNPTLVVLGASGDMARRLLFPALFGLEQQKRLGGLRIVAYARRDWTRQQCLDIIAEGITDLAGLEIAKSTWARFARRVSFVKGDLIAEDFRQLHECIEGDAAFYLALPPDLFPTAAKGLAEAGLSSETKGWRRLVIEKPFGVDLDSAVGLNKSLHTDWDEQQLFRIDHYLGKETVQNILVFRFANRFLEPVLNCNHVDYIQITAAETLGLEGRAGYYEGIGAMRDMLQSHLMQLVALVAMEPLAKWDNDLLHDHKVEALRSVRPLRPADVKKQAVRGQYGAGSDGVAYLDEPGVEKNSTTETFAALKLHIDNWRWAGTPIYLRSGKRLASNLTEVAIHFRQPPFHLPGNDGFVPTGNRLVFQLRPHESINLAVEARAPGFTMRTESLMLHADYEESSTSASASYRQLILDLLENERTAFLRFDEVEWAWRILDPVLKAWSKGKPESYESGSDGPEGQHSLLQSGHRWRDLTEDPLPKHD